jgi:2-pyrone-4,6-dicarboxylate lactonase
MSETHKIVQTFNPHPSQPSLKLPKGACDAHVHVFGPRAVFPFDPERQSTPQDAPKELLFKWHKQMGIERCVIVQSMVHALDNRVVEDAIKAGGGIIWAWRFYRLMFQMQSCSDWLRSVLRVFGLTL